MSIQPKVFYEKHPSNVIKNVSVSSKIVTILQIFAKACQNFSMECRNSWQVHCIGKFLTKGPQHLLIHPQLQPSE